mgnify:CR=1 FL=1
MKLDSDKLREIAKQYDLTPQQVYDVINSQFEFVSMLNDAARVLSDGKTEVKSSLESKLIYK